MTQSTRQPSFYDPIHKVEFDHLGRYQFAQRILNRVSAPQCSYAVGLYGGWGTGKTSILKLMEALNEQAAAALLNKPLLQYIDVWPYEVSGDLALPILIHMRQWLKDINPATYSVNWRKILGVLAQAGVDVALRKLLDLPLSTVEEYVNRVKDIETLADDIKGAQDAFCNLVQLVSEAHQNRRIVFLIDNLDRCSPENVVRLLESVRNFLYAPNCVWVLAVDSGVVASYIDHKYEGTRMDGNSYLDKIVPEQYHIPPISDQDMSRLHRFLATVQPSNANGLPTVNLSKIPQLPEVLVPRRILKTAHKFYEAYSSNLSTGTSAGPDVVFSLILLYNAWPAFYERFSSSKAEHVYGILLNFIGNPMEQKDRERIPLSETFTEDRALRHYLTHCFLQGQDLSAMCSTLSSCMMWLREVGLP